MIMRPWIIVSFYWVVAVVAVYAIRAYNEKKNRLKIAAFEALGIVKTPSLWKRIGTHASIIFLLPPLMPVVILVFIIDKSLKHNKMKKKMKTETEPQEEKKYTAKMEENLPNDIFTQASKVMLDALIYGIFDDFENMLDEKVETVLYRLKTIKGKADVVFYWWDWRKRFVATKKVTNFKVVMSRYYSHACIRIEEVQLIMFQIEEGKIVKIVSLPERLTSAYSDDNMLNYPLEYVRIKQFLAPLEESVDKDGNPMPLTDRIPCLHCGTESQDLRWYSIRIPEWFYKNWTLGQVSVCPHCGRVVEYKEVKTEESEDEKDVPVEGSKYSDKGNEFSGYAEKMYGKDRISFLEKAVDDEIVPELREVVRKAFVDHLIPEPSEISVEDGCRFDLSMPSFEGSGDITHIKIVDAEGNETEDLIEHLKVNATEMAVWQLFLLENYLTVLPTVWHGGYNRCEYIFKESDVDGIIPLKYHDLTALIKQGKLLPLVKVSKEDEDSYVAFVDCTYWNNWKGLARERVTYKIKAGSVVSKTRNEEILFQFHCGMWY